MKEVIGKINSSAGARPWSGTCARMKVIESPKGTKDRYKKLRERKMAWNQILSKSRHVTVRFEMGREDCNALLDTGADWSLIDDSLLNEEERRELEQSGEHGLYGRGVSGESITISGEVWRTLTLGELCISEQRFVVVQGLSSQVILGADFWARVSPLQIDFHNRKLKMCGGTYEVSIFDPAEESEIHNVESAGIRVSTAIRCKLPPRAERVVKCRTDKPMTGGKNYIFEPARGDDDRFGAPYSIHSQGAVVGECWIKVVNLGDMEEELCDGYELGKLCQIKGVCREPREPLKPITIRGKKNLLNSLKIGQNLTCGQKEELRNLLAKFSMVFYTGGPLPLVDVGVEHTVRVKEPATPMACRPRRLDPVSEQEVKREIEKLIKMGVIRQSNSPWAAPVVCARRADGTLRLALDYRKLNEESEPATLHPIPLIDDLLDRLASAQYFSVLDAKAGYHQMPLKKEDSEVTAFVVPWGQYEWAERTPFGLKGAGYSFQRMMATVLSSSNFTEALCYLDDILVWGNTWEVHFERLKSVLEKVSWAGLALNPSKCQFGVSEVTYLGSIIRKGMVSIGDQRVEDLRSLPVPRTVRELRRVLGGFSFVQRWLPGIADVAKPLNAGVKGKPHSKLRWTVEMHNAFRRMKQLVAEATALKIPDHNREFTLITDCSDKGAGAVLTQEEKGTRIPVAYFHHTLTPAETRYTTTDKELLAVVLAVSKFRVYLTKRFNLITDHQAVRWLTGMNIHDEKGRRGRWIEFLQNFDIRLMHRSGKSPELSMADYLSRVSHEPIGNNEEIHRSVCKSSMQQVEEPSSRMGIECIKRQQRKHFPELLDALKTGDAKVDAQKMVSDDTMDMKVLDRIALDSHGLMVIVFNGGRRKKSAAFGVKSINRIVIPPGIRKQAMKICHSSGFGGHMGVERTWQ